MRVGGVGQFHLTYAASPPPPPPLTIMKKMAACTFYENALRHQQ